MTCGLTLLCSLLHAWITATVRGERPVMDLKYDILKHPDVRMTADGGADKYIHGQPKDAAFTLNLTFDPEDIAFANAMKDVIEIPEGDYVLLSEEDVEKEIKKQSKKL